MKALLALFIRALRVDARAKSTYWMRAGLIALVLCAMLERLAFSSWAGAPGLRVFGDVIWLDLFFVSVAGLSFFASAITEEKEDGTLGLLRMTDLNALSILLGKSTNRLLGALLLLAAQLPFTLLAVTLGGVSRGQVAAAYIALGAYIFFLANLALFSSVLCWRNGSAASLTGGLLVFFLSGPYLLPALLYKWPLPPEFLARWRECSPILRLNSVLSTSFSGEPLALQAYSNLALGGLCFLAAWAFFNRFADRPGESASGPVRQVRRRYRVGRAWSQALVWKDYHFIGGGRTLIFVKCGFLVFLIGFFYWLNTEYEMFQEKAWVGWMLGVTGFIWFLDLASMAGRVFRSERRDQTLSALASLPMSIQRAAWQKVLGCVCVTWPQALFFLGSCVILLPELWRDLLRPNAGDFATFFILFLVNLFLGVVAFIYLIAWFSLRVKAGAFALAAVVGVLGCIFVVPLLGMMFREGVLVAVPMIEALLITLMHVGIGDRLEQLAAED